MNNMITIMLSLQAEYYYFPRDADLIPLNTTVECYKDSSNKMGVDTVLNYIAFSLILQVTYPTAFLYPLSSKITMYKTVTKSRRIIFGKEETRRNIARVRVPTTQERKA